MLGLAVLAATARDAEAYVDPGSGSMLVQLLLGGLMAAVVMVRTWWHRLRGLVRRHPDPGEE